MNYLASPYSHPSGQVRQLRFKLVCEAAAALMKRGNVIFSPIAHSHSIECEAGFMEGFDFWMKQDLPILEKCSELWVMEIEGWKESKGVTREILHAKTIRIPIRYGTYAEMLSGIRPYREEPTRAGS